MSAALCLTFMPRLIPVGINYAIVDDDDYEWLCQFTWWMTATRYAATKIHGKDVLMHRLILNQEDQLETDHRNGFGLDNRRCNLRSATRAENMRNARKTAKPDRITSSRYKGVYFRNDRQRWSAYINVNKKRTWLGCYATEEIAASVYNNAASVMHGTFARLNEIT